VPVEADLRLVTDHGVHRRDPVPGVAEDQRTGRVHHVHAVRAGVDHDPGLPGQVGRIVAVGHHQEPDRLHSQRPGQPKCCADTPASVQWVAIRAMAAPASRASRRSFMVLIPGTSSTAIRAEVASATAARIRSISLVPEKP